ncbi:hypothetical protein ACIBP4_17845 [Micromonospora maritima]|uniref:Uncharacterized protein n=1 Tax=Micromonospora maritima TaxID=986711 RepID=A0ABW7ZMS5_9ACTN
MTEDADDAVPAVRQAAARCHRLLVARIIALLDDPELGGAAAANPALPLDRLRDLLAG